MSERSAPKAHQASLVSGKPKPNPRQQKAIDDAVAFCRAKPEPYRTEVEQVQANRLMKASPPHSNTPGWLVHRTRTFGTASLEFAESCEGWLAQIVTRTDAEGATETDLNAALAAVGGVEPRDEVEAMLAVQMASTHETAMSMLSTAKHATMVEHAEKFGNLAVKLMRTYTAQAEALAKLRRKGEQTVRVEHVNVYPGGQAIVGPVTTGQPGGGGHADDGRQPHAPIDPRALAVAPLAPVLCPDAGRDRVPVPRGEGEEAVSDAWRELPEWSPKR